MASWEWALLALDQMVLVGNSCHDEVGIENDFHESIADYEAGPKNSGPLGIASY